MADGGAAAPEAAVDHAPVSFKAAVAAVVAATTASTVSEFKVRKPRPEACSTVSRGLGKELVKDVGEEASSVAMV